MTALIPQLTAYDERVLAAVQRPRRAMGIARDLTPRPPGSQVMWTEATHLRYGREVQRTLVDVERTLRGLEHLGLVRRTRNGWYRAT